VSTVTETPKDYVPRLKQAYNEEIRPRLKDELGLGTVMQVPRVTKITLNMGVGEAKTDAKALDAALEELTIIAGQQAQVRRAKKSFNHVCSAAAAGAMAGVTIIGPLRSFAPRDDLSRSARRVSCRFGLRFQGRLSPSHPDLDRLNNRNVIPGGHSQCALQQT
jgi:hypothetical protein